MNFIGPYFANFTLTLKGDPPADCYLSFPACWAQIACLLPYTQRKLDILSMSDCYYDLLGTFI